MSAPPLQSRPPPLGVPLANGDDIMLQDVEDSIVSIVNGEVGVFDSFTAQIAICNDLRANGAFQISNADDAATVGFAVEEGTTSYDLTLPMALPTSTRFLTVDTLGAMGYGDAGAASWSACFSGPASGFGGVVLGNMNEGKSDAEWAALATGVGAQLLQQDQTTGAVSAITPAANTISDPPGAPGYALPAGTAFRSLVSQDARVYKNLFVAGSYYLLANYAFTTIMNYSSGSFADDATALTNAPPAGVLGSAVINMTGAGPVSVDYAAAAADANGLPSASPGYRCLIRGEDIHDLINAFPGPWLSLPWQRTAFATS